MDLRRRGAVSDGAHGGRRGVLRSDPVPAPPHGELQRGLLQPLLLRAPHLLPHGGGEEVVLLPAVRQGEGRRQPLRLRRARALLPLEPVHAGVPEVAPRELHARRDVHAPPPLRRAVLMRGEQRRAQGVQQAARARDPRRLCARCVVDLRAGEQRDDRAVRRRHPRDADALRHLPHPRVRPGERRRRTRRLPLRDADRDVLLLRQALHVLLLLGDCEEVAVLRRRQREGGRRPAGRPQHRGGQQAAARHDVLLVHGDGRGPHRHGEGTRRVAAAGEVCEDAYLCDEDAVEGDAAGGCQEGTGGCEGRRRVHDDVVNPPPPPSCKRNQHPSPPPPHLIPFRVLLFPFLSSPPTTYSCPPDRAPTRRYYY
eukprot:Rhum_TRINITY_DN14247_c19_g1::Rhum_TRINITY_DN14247_c19_g1_i1::g.77302::m.77302